MTDTPDLWWPTVLLASILVADALASIRPPALIRGCLEGVGFPLDWGWALIVVKLLAAAGLIAGLKYDGVGLTTSIAVIAYFLCASYAHIRSRFLGTEFWVNCLGMLALSTGVLVVTYFL